MATDDDDDDDDDDVFFATLQTGIGFNRPEMLS